MLKCGITGASGVLGQKLKKNLPYIFFSFKENIENYNKVYKWINSQQFDLILHLAAIVPANKVNNNFLRAKKININGTKNLVRAILNSKLPPKWVFYASTSHVYKPHLKSKKLSEKTIIKPYSKYGQTKRGGEIILEKNFKNRNIKFCVGRIFSFTDKLQKKPYVIPTLLTKIKTKDKKKILLKNLNHYRDFISTKDISKAIKILFKNKKSGIYNIGSGNEINLKLIASIIAKKYKKKIFFSKDNKPTYLISNSDKLKKLGWRPKKFEKILIYFY